MNSKKLEKEIEQVRDLACIVTENQKRLNEYILKIPVPQTSIYYKGIETFITFKITIPHSYPLEKMESHILDTDTIIHPMIPLEEDYPRIWECIICGKYFNKLNGKQLLTLTKTILDFLNYKDDYQEACKDIIKRIGGLNCLSLAIKNKKYCDMVKCMSERGQEFTIYWLLSGKEGYEEDLTIHNSLN